jgi:hypothetical protein
MKKIEIDAYPKDGSADYSHLQPILDYLIENGNSSVNTYLWGSNRTGYFCHLKNDIDFDGIRKDFDLPNSIKLNESTQTIDCFNTYAVIKKV